jgi:aspartate carbamoyltransferase catalytic subunit
LSAYPEKARSILSIDDLSDVDILDILDRSAVLVATDAPTTRRSFIAGLLFLTPSLRTRVGYATATARLGGTPIDVGEQRFGSDMSSPESMHDTLQTVRGMVDVLITRTHTPLSLESAGAPVINGGAAGGEHPTQALIDMFAIRRARADIGELRIGLCGDMMARTATSLLHLLARFLPGSLSLMSPEERAVDVATFAPDLLERTTVLPNADFSGLDVLYMIGLAPGMGDDRLGEHARRPYRLDKRSATTLPAHAIVLSPMPVIDEIDDDVRSDPRLKMFEQSDHGVAVRMACIEYCLRMWERRA